MFLGVFGSVCWSTDVGACARAREARKARGGVGAARSRVGAQWVKRVRPHLLLVQRACVNRAVRV